MVNEGSFEEKNHCSLDFKPKKQGDITFTLISQILGFSPCA